MSLDFSTVAICSEKYPLSQNFTPFYGTAGFRGPANLITGAVFRAGLLTALRALATKGTCGLVVTASHNPPTDNGVKIVDCNGEMLCIEWEKYANMLAQANTPSEIIETCRSICETENISNIVRGEENKIEVVVGYDTRESSPALVKVAQEGIEALGVRVAEEANLQTTPQVHFRVYKKSQNLAYGEFQWVKYMAGGYMRMARGTKQRYGVLTVDCANGVGAMKLERLGNCPGAVAQGYKFELLNTGNGVLNEKCGSEYVQKNKELPIGFEKIEDWKRCASIDGDADRVIYFTKADGKVIILDGDRIAALLAVHVKDILSMNLKFQNQYKVGIVQTAYANSAATKFLKEVLQVEVCRVPTGVKHLHAAAKQFDIGIYYEANGHGTVLFESELAAILRETEDHENKEPGDFELLALLDTMNQAVGDAVSGILAVEAILRKQKWGLKDWLKLYEEVPSANLTFGISNATVLKTDEIEMRVIQPEGLQGMIDEAVGRVKNGRVFVRPSGTENVIRVYAEGDSDESAAKLANEVLELTKRALGA